MDDVALRVILLLGLTLVRLGFIGQDLALRPYIFSGS